MQTHVHLTDGTAVRDTGMRLTADAITPKAAEAMALGAVEKGWTEVNLTGSKEEKETMAKAMVARGIQVLNPEMQRFVNLLSGGKVVIFEMGALRHWLFWIPARRVGLEAVAAAGRIDGTGTRKPPWHRRRPGYGTTATVTEWLDNWTVTGADDGRIAYGLRLALGLHPAPAPVGITIMVEWRGADPVVHYGRAGGDLERAELPDLISAARHLLAADDPPSWPDVAPPKSKPVQMSLFWVLGHVPSSGVAAFAWG